MPDEFNLSRREFLMLAGAAAIGWSPLRALARAGETNDTSPVGAGQRVDRPNILHIMTDDQDFQSWSEKFTYVDRRGAAVVDAGGNPLQDYAMKFTRGYPGGGWTNFTQHTCSTAICGPSRAAILTGVPAREHGVMRNGYINNLDETNTLATWLTSAGYRTHLIGKYSFGVRGRNHPTPPGWTTFRGKGGLSKSVFGAGVECIHEMASDPTPWAMFLWPVDPHRRAKPNPQNAKIALKPPPLPGNINEENVDDKPSWVRNSRLLSEGRLKAAERERVRGYQALMGVDQGIEQVVNALIATGQFERTIIIVTADNGESWGSHRQFFKDMIYDEASRVPLAIRVPWAQENRDENRVISALDVTATIVEACGATPGRPLLGKSLLSIIDSGAAAPWEGVAYVESHGSPGARSKGRPAFKGLRVGGDGWGQYSYAWYPVTNEVELYDREADPGQMENVAGRPEYDEVQSALAARLEAILMRPPYSK